MRGAILFAIVSGMASADEVKKLASLARIQIAPEESEKFAKEFESILAYIGKLEELNIDIKTKMVPEVRNIFREDTAPHAPGAYAEKLVEQFPEKEGNLLSVKQIISHD